MATFDITLDANYIYLRNGEGTLNQLYDDLFALAGDAETYMTKTGADPYVYTVLSGRGIYIQGSLGITTLNISNAGDTLDFVPAANARTMLYVYVGTYKCKLTATDDVTIDVDSLDLRQGTIVIFYGAINLVGSSGHPVTIDHVADIYHYGYVGQDPQVYNYVDLNLQYRNGSAISIGVYIRRGTAGSRDLQLTMSNVNITALTAGCSSGMYFDYFGDYSGCTFEDIVIDLCATPNFYGTTAKFTNLTIQHCTGSTGILGCGAIWARGNYKTATTPDTNSSDFLTQPKLVFKNCTFHDNRTTIEWCLSASGGSLVFVDGCTFSGDPADPATYGMTVFQSAAILERGSVFTDVTTNRYWDSKGTYLHVWGLDLTVNDENGVAIPNATVQVRQKENKEVWDFQTNASGQIEDLYGDDPVFVEKEQTSAAVFVQWSDGSTDDKKHEILISKPGYQVWRRDVAFTADQVITAVLIPALREKELPNSY